MFDQASTAMQVSLLIVAVAALSALAAAIRAPRSVLLFAGGLVAALVSGSPRDVVEPHLLIGLILPPLLYGATVTTSLALLRRVALPGLAVGVALAVVTATAAGAVTAVTVPTLSWSAFALVGIIAATADTRLVSELELEVRVPRAVEEALRGQAVVAPLVLLSAFLLALDHQGGPPPDATDVVGAVATDWVAGGLLGIVIGWTISRIRRALETGPIEIALSIATPFAVAAIAETLSVSVIAPLIAAALTISTLGIQEDGRTVSSPDARLIGRIFWREATVMLAGIQFFLSGFVLPGALAELDSYRPEHAALLAVTLAATVGLVQVALGRVAAAVMPGSLAGADPRWRLGLMIGLLPGRSGLALLIALAVPASLPGAERVAERDLIVVTVVFLVVGSLLLNWAITAPLLRTLAIDPAHSREKERAVAAEVLAGVDGTNNPAVAAARVELTRLRRLGVLGDDAFIDAQQRLDLAVNGRSTLNAVC